MTIAETLQAAEILRAAQTYAKIAYVAESGDVLYGHARSVGNEYGSFGGSDQDVRGMFLRITLQSGFEAFEPMSKLMPLVETGEFATYDW